MQIKITGSGEDIDYDKSVDYAIVIETDLYKTTLTINEYADAFDDFASKLLELPFESKQAAVYELGNWDNSAYYLRLAVSLADPAGRIRFDVSTKDNTSDGGEARFHDIVETQPLHDLANKLLRINFALPAELVWNSSSLDT